MYIINPRGLAVYLAKTQHMNNRCAVKNRQEAGNSGGVLTTGCYG